MLGIDQGQLIPYQIADSSFLGELGPWELSQEPAEEHRGHKDS
jgi:hypothetical protein